MIKIEVGTTFHYNYHDGKPLWTVKSKRRGDTWNCEVEKDVDWSGARKVFSTEEIASAINFDNFWNGLIKESNDYYDRLPPGAIVHYTNRFNEFVRCQVMENHELMPLCLVGDWAKMDFPRRGRNGEIELPYYASLIVNKKTFKPSAANIWEYHTWPGDTVNPITLQEIPLMKYITPPTESEENQLKNYMKCEMIKKAIQKHTSSEALDIIKKILEDKPL